VKEVPLIVTNEFSVAATAYLVYLSMHYNKDCRNVISQRSLLNLEITL
jgi:hypothetical protein